MISLWEQLIDLTDELVGELGKPSELETEGDIKLYNQAVIMRAYFKKQPDVEIVKVINNSGKNEHTTETVSLDYCGVGEVIKTLEEATLNLRVVCQKMKSKHRCLIQLGG